MPSFAQQLAATRQDLSHAQREALFASELCVAEGLVASQG